MEYCTELMQWLRPLRHVQPLSLPPRTVSHPWSLFGDDICVHLLRILLLHSTLDTFIAFLSAFPELCRYVGLVSDGELCFAPGVEAFSIWNLEPHRNYDERPLVLFILRNTSQHDRFDAFQLLQRHSYYFTASSFVYIEVPTVHCFLVDALEHFTSKRGAILLPPVVRYNGGMYRSYQCLTELNEVQTPETAPLFQERSLVLRPNGCYGFDLLGRLRCLDVVDVVNLDMLEDVESVEELRARFNHRRCTPNMCYPNKVIFRPRAPFSLPQMCIMFRGGDVPFIAYEPLLDIDILPLILEIVLEILKALLGQVPTSNLELLNLEWSPQNFYGTRCSQLERHRASEDVGWRDLVERPMSFTDMYGRFSYIGVPIETVLRTSFMSAKELVWKRLSLIDRCRQSQRLVVQDFRHPRIQRLMHNQHRIVGDHVAIAAKNLRTLKIWSHINREERLPVFKAPVLETLVLVALSNSEISWNINSLLNARRSLRSAPAIKKAVIAAIGTIPGTVNPILDWNHYSILAPSVIDLTVIGYTLDKLCGGINTSHGAFEKLKSLSIDVTNLPHTHGPEAHFRMSVPVSRLDFPLLKHLDLSSPYNGSLNFPVLKHCCTDVSVPYTCVSVTTTTALAAHPLFINGLEMETGGKHKVRDGRWRVRWMRSEDEAFSYKETFRLPIDPDILEMNE